MSATRDYSLDIAKGICILFMVVGHSGCPAYLQTFIYMFHMPCFFFVSGWLLNDKYLSDLKKGLYQKAKGSYYPFVKWTLIFLLFHNVFTSLHVYDTRYTLSMYVERIIRAFTLTGSEQLLGGFWFLISLFWASIGSLLFLWLLRKFNRVTLGNLSGGVVLSLLAAMFWHSISGYLPQMFREQTLLATAFYLSGYLCKKLDLQFLCSFKKGVIWLLVPAIAACFMQLNMQTEGWKVLVTYSIAMCGIFGVISLSKWLTKYGCTLMAYIGNKTLYILIFHFLLFKVVSVLYLCVKGLPIEQLSEFPVLRNTTSWMWVVYTLAGVLFPLAVWKLQNTIVSLGRSVRKKDVV